ncbi:hypothetical protein PUG42_19805 [Erwiniaceae bacterium L1_54_3]|nr:hypothetical protein [Erwiniaceae bacterium L1_54_3]
MDLDEERAVMIANAIGTAVLQMRIQDESLTDYTLSEKLEDMRRKETNVIGKGVYRDAAEIVRTGRLPVA